MNHSLLNPEVQAFINTSLTKNVSTLSLQKNPFPDLVYATIIQQIDSKQRCKTKLPTWFAGSNLLFPPKLSIEQTSSEVCAAYKASLVCGDTLIDLTGGFGVDAYFFSKRIAAVTHCEMQEDLSAMVAHNFKELQAENISCYCGDSLDFLLEQDQKWDYIYLDPARRNDSKEKVFLLKDCTPNAPELLSDYFKYTDTILLKTAPLLDITSGILELHSVKEIHIVALNNEVKELLWILQKDWDKAPEVVAVNLHQDQVDSIRIPLDNEEYAHYAAPLEYLYEPNAALMKSGQFDFISTHFDLFKLHPHSQLYTSTVLKPFAGRRFKIEANIPFNNKSAKEHLKDYKGHITTRNFPMKVEEIRKKWKLKDAENNYLFFTTDSKNNKIMLFCSKIN